MVLRLQKPKSSEQSFINFPFSRLHWVFMSLHYCMNILKFSIQANVSAEIFFPCHIIFGSTNALTFALDSLEVLQQWTYWENCLENESDLA